MRAAHEAAKWTTKSRADNEEYFDKEFAANLFYRKKALEAPEPFHDRSPVEWRGLCKSFAKRTAVGADNVSFEQFAELPEEAWGVFNQMCREIGVMLVWPTQFLVVSV